MGTIDIHLQQLRVVKKNDLIGKDEPYIWMFGFVIGTQSMTRRQLVIERSPGPRNMGSVAKGETKTIPESAGHIVVDDTMMAAGAIWMAWEDDGRSTSSVQSAYRAVCRRINEALLSRVDAFNLGAPTTEELIALGTVLTLEVASAYGTVVSPVSVLSDSLIGLDYISWNLPVPLRSQTINIDSTLRGLLGGTEYRVTGRLQFTP